MVPMRMTSFRAMLSVARASCRKDASCQKRRDHECGILAFAGANLLVRWSRGQKAPKSPGMRSKPSSQGIAHRRRPLRDTKRAEDSPSSPKSLREQKSYRGFWVILEIGNEIGNKVPFVARPLSIRL